jgi:hypothetical protein
VNGEARGKVNEATRGQMNGGGKGAGEWMNGAVSGKVNGAAWSWNHHCTHACTHAAHPPNAHMRLVDIIIIILLCVNYKGLAVLPDLI